MSENVSQNSRKFIWHHSVAATRNVANGDRRSGELRRGALGAHLRIAHNEVEHDLDRGDDRGKDQTAECKETTYGILQGM